MKNINQNPFTTRPEIDGTFGVVTSTHWIATAVLAACVPGTFESWMLLLRDYGTMRLSDVLAPAIGYASQGYPLVERTQATIATVEALFREHWPSSAEVYLPGGKVPEAGALFTNKTLAETYARILREAEGAGGDRVTQIEAARKSWSQGFVAEAIDRFCRTQAVMDTSGEPHLVEVPMATLLSDAYNDERRKLVGEDASLELRPGSVAGFGAVVKLRRAEGERRAVGGMGAGEPTVGRLGEMRGDTVHFDIIDAAGNIVSATPSGGWLHSSPVIPELGFCLGTRAQMVWLEARHPAALAPGKRPRTTLSPTLALRDGEPYLAWGSPGGDQQDQWTTQLFMRHVHAGMNLQEAIDAPAWHSEHFPISFWPRTARPGVLVLERRLPGATIAELERRGHLVEIDAEWCEGRLTAAARDGKRRRAAANPRCMQGYAAGR